MNVDPWDLAGVPQSRMCVYWKNHALAAERAEMAAEKARMDKAERKARQKRGR